MVGWMLVLNNYSWTCNCVFIRFDFQQNIVMTYVSAISPPGGDKI